MKKIFCIKDEKSGAHYDPFTMSNSIDAQRAFMQGIKSEKSIISQYPEDFNLYFVGEFDEMSGLITPREAPVLILTGKDVKDSLRKE
jgi:hypothetical protein